MFERYTERARRVIFFARYEASQLGSATIETEHLLLGLIREDKNLILPFIRTSSFADNILQEINERTGFRENVSKSIDLPLSSECKRILAYATEESERFHDRHIGTEQLLLGILREEKCFAAGLLRAYGVKGSAIREELSRPARDLDHVLKFMGGKLINMISFDAGVFYIACLSEGTVKAQHVIGPHSNELLGSAIPLEKILSGWVAANNQSVSNLPPFPDFMRLPEPRPTFRISVMVPLHRNGQVLGTIALYRKDNTRFSEVDSLRLELLAAQTSIAIPPTQFESHNEPVLFDQGLPVTSAPDVSHDLMRYVNVLIKSLETHGFIESKSSLSIAESAGELEDWATARTELQIFLETLVDAIDERLKGDDAAFPLFEGFDWRVSLRGLQSGLSDYEDWRFRYRLALLLAEVLLKRFEQRLNSEPGKS